MLASLLIQLVVVKVSPSLDHPPVSVLSWVLPF